jgi:Fur family zinc uptake transcriptional regulator
MTDTSHSAVNGFVQHDHTHCVSDALSRADALCAERKVQFTPVRRRVLEILLETHKALGAYEVLERLAAEGLGSKPPVAYRALSFLVEQGFAHRIEGLNAFVACTHPEQDHAPAFMICRSCNKVTEASGKGDSSFGSIATETGFVIEQTVIEAQGLCPNCVEA